MTDETSPPQDDPDGSSAEQETTNSQSPTDSQCSTGSVMSEVIDEMMQADFLESHTPTLQNECINELLKYLHSDSTDTHEPINENQPDILSVKSEPQLDAASPDSGYQPPSNASCTSISTGTGDEVSTSHFSLDQRPAMYEISPQPVIVSPPRKNLPGKYNFRIAFEQNDSSPIPKNIGHTHSRVLDKMFVKPDSPCPIWFHCSESPPDGSFIRGMLVFLKQEHVHEAVCRCQTHKLKQEDGYLAPHVLQTVMRRQYLDQFGPQYDTSKGRFSVVCGYEGANSASHGDEEFMIQYKFMCLSTCVGGINRRPVLAVFTLEDPMGVTLGRACVEVKVCSSPGRDRTREEEKRKNATQSGRVLVPLPRKRSAGSNDALVGYKFLRVKDKHFELLSSINDALNISDMVSDEQRQQYLGEQKNPLVEVLKMLNKDDSL